MGQGAEERLKELRERERARKASYRARRKNGAGAGVVPVGVVEHSDLEGTGGTFLVSDGGDLAGRAEPGGGRSVLGEGEIPEWKPLTPESLRELVAAAPRRRMARPKRVEKLDEWGESFRDHFWPDYLKLGRPCSVAEALKAWQSVPHSGGQEDFDSLWEAYGVAKAEWATRSDPAFIPHAATWLNRYAKDKALRMGGML